MFGKGIGWIGSIVFMLVHGVMSIAALGYAWDGYLQEYRMLIAWLLTAVLNVVLFVHFQRKKKPSVRNVLQLFVCALPMMLEVVMIVDIVSIGRGGTLLAAPQPVDIIVNGIGRLYLCTCILPLVQLVRITALWIVRLHRGQPAQTEQPPFTPRQKTAVKVVAVAAAVVLAAGCAYLAGDGRRLHNVVACEYRQEAEVRKVSGSLYLRPETTGVPLSQEDAQTIAALLRSETYILWKDTARYEDLHRQYLVFRMADGRTETVLLPADRTGYACLVRTGVQCRLSPQDSQALYDVLQKYAHDGEAAGE